MQRCLLAACLAAGCGDNLPQCGFAQPLSTLRNIWPHQLAIESDGGVFMPTGFGFTGTPAARAAVEAIGKLLEPIGAGTIGAQGGGADIGPIMATGVPGMGLNVEDSKYFWFHHTDADTTDKLDPYSKQLHDFARKIGADYVVVTSAYLGPVTTVVREPVTTYSHGYTTVGPHRRGRARSLSYSDTSTTWVPVQVTEDAYHYRAFFLRRARPGDSP